MAAKKKVEEAENNLPDHIKDIILQPHHIYASKNRKTGEITLSTTKDLVTDLMRQFKLGFRITEFRVDNFRGDQTLVSIEIVVVDENDHNHMTPGVATMDKMPYGDQGQALLGQMVLTHALKNAVMRHLHITNHDIDLLIEKYGLKPTVNAAREVIDVAEEIEDTPLDLGEGFGSELEL